MPYKTNIPNASQSPGLFPAQAQENFTRLKNIISANHKFNDSADPATDGFHQIIKIIPSAEPANNSSVGQSFVNSADSTNQLYHKDGLNRVFQITPCLPLRAAIVFTPAGPNGTVSYAFNATMGIKQGVGIYRIAFTNAIPTVNYYWSINLIPVNSTGGVMATGRNNTAPLTTRFDITVRDEAGVGNDSFVAVCALFYGG